jgi:hypothetical protein
MGSVALVEVEVVDDVVVDVVFVDVVDVVVVSVESIESLELLFLEQFNRKTELKPNNKKFVVRFITTPSCCSYC